MKALAFAALLAAGCDGVRTHPFGTAPTDAPADADVPADAPLDAPLALHHYVISAEQLPDANKSAMALGLDLDGDEVVDNRFGVVMSLIAQQGFNPSNAANDAIQRGNVLLLGELAADSYTDGPATFTLYTGTNPDPPPCLQLGPLVCGRHLHGDATFDVDLASARYAPLHGTLVGGELLTDVAAPADGKLRIKVTFFENPVTLELVAARLALSMPSDDGIVSGVIGGALTPEIVDGILPELANALNATVTAECDGSKPWPGCGCTEAGGAGQGIGGKLIAQFDANHDCMITSVGVDRQQLATQFMPDLANNTLVSFGIGFTAVKATYTP